VDGIIDVSIAIVVNAIIAISVLIAFWHWHIRRYTYQFAVVALIFTTRTGAVLIGNGAEFVFFGKSFVDLPIAIIVYTIADFCSDSSGISLASSPSTIDTFLDSSSTV
jgi:hypothetical protein